MTADIAIVNLDRGFAVTDDGQQLPVTAWIDDDEESCAPAEAAICIAGPDADGFYFTIDLRGFATVRLH